MYSIGEIWSNDEVRQVVFLFSVCDSYYEWILTCVSQGQLISVYNTTICRILEGCSQLKVVPEGQLISPFT